MDAEILRNEAARRFETAVDGSLCVLDYSLQDDVLAIEHVRVPDAVAGRGIAGLLTARAFDMARRQHWRVSPDCAYAAAWIKRHPEYADLVTGSLSRELATRL